MNDDIDSEFDQYTYTIDGCNYRLEKTCSAFPEQYDMFDAANNFVGYFRLRSGYYRVGHLTNNDFNTITYVYEKYVGIDSYQGFFETEGQRVFELERGIKAVHTAIINS